MEIKNKILTAVKFIVCLIAVVCIVNIIPSGEAKAAGGLLQITAVYTGNAVAVGEEINPEQIVVMGIYDDGSHTRLTDFIMSYTRVMNEGDNQIMIICQGKYAMINVPGKTLSSLTATYTGEDISIGKEYDTQYLIVTAYYSDGSYNRVADFTVNSKRIKNIGPNVFTATYNGYTAEFRVMGKSEVSLSYIMAYYTGDSLVVGSTISKSDIEVYAVYSNGTTQDIENFSFSPTKVQAVGRNNITVAYGGKTTPVFVYGLEKNIVDITVEYKGGSVAIGKNVDINNIVVTALYNDGTKGNIVDFTLSTSVITEEGTNYIFVYYNGEVVGFLEITGVVAPVADYSNTTTTVLVDGSDVSFVTFAMDANMKQGDITLKQLTGDEVERAVKKISNTKKYLAFEVGVVSDDIRDDFPFFIKVTVPASYDASKLKVFFTPNKQTIMAEMVGEFTNESKIEYEFSAYLPGTYVILEEGGAILVEEIKPVEESIVMKKGRSHAIETIVLPKNAENKNISYESSDPTVATVTDTGKIRAVEKGVCLIMMKARDGSGVISYMLVQVE